MKIIELHPDWNIHIYYKANRNLKTGDLLVVPCAICGKNAVGRGYTDRYQEYPGFSDEEIYNHGCMINICDPCDNDVPDNYPDEVLFKTEEGILLKAECVGRGND